MASSSDDETDPVPYIITTYLSAATFHLSNAQATRPAMTRKDALNRDRLSGHERLVADYFADDVVYDEDIFKRRFCITKEVFLRIAIDLKARYSFFRLSYDARGRRGFTTYQKCTAALCQMGYGTASDSWDEYLRMSESLARRCMYMFCRCVIEVYESEYMRKPNANDVCRLYEAHEEKYGFPGMLGSLDCMHWEWYNCPTAWTGQFMRGDRPHPTMVLEAVASYDLWIWHSFFGVAGSNNDINVLDQSNLFDHVIKGRAPNTSFQVGGVTYNHGYYLVDGIYPEWATLVKTFAQPIGEKRRVFAAAQESARKDIKRAFGVLKKKWYIIANPARAWEPEKLQK